MPLNKDTLNLWISSLDHIYIYIYIRFPTGVEHSGEGIYGYHSYNTKLFERIELSGIR